ncbi:Lysophospholipase L1 [Ruminococcaceae bacterium FB2012]|nr:Lysophospholipase L1 [Ruminococcaceae bacterium FB2012]
MKRFLAVTLALIVTAALLAGCGGSDSSSKTESKADASAAESKAEESKAEESKAAESTPAESTSDESAAPAADDKTAPAASPFTPDFDNITENMLTRSVHSAGNADRLIAKLKAAKAGTEKKLTQIAFLGDSITAGSGATNSKYQYVKLFDNWFKENVSVLYKVTNAGIGATDSYLGVHRVDKDVLSLNPDIIFIEFINDRDDEFYQATMDSLIRKCLAAPTNPAVVLVEMSLKGGGNCQTAHSKAAETYGVPVLSYHDAITPEIDAGNFKFDDLSKDGTHPNNIGHTWVAKIIENFCQQCMDSDKTPEITPFDASVASPTGDKYAGGKVSDLSTEDITVKDQGNWVEASTPWNFQNGWSVGEPGTITFEMEFKNLGMVYYKDVSGKAGKAKVAVDGADVMEVDGDFTGGWGSYAANVECYSSDEVKKHTVTVTIPEGDKTEFEILAWLIS